MQVVVTFRNIEASDAVRDHAVGKLQRVRKFMRRPIEAHVVLGVIKHRHLAEITVVANRVTFNATDETGDLYSAVDGAMAKIERQVKKHESKRQSRKYETAPATRREARAEERPRIEIERVVVKPMSIEEAAMELESTKGEFLLFENTESDLLSVLQRGKGGKFRVLEPEVE